MAHRKPLGTICRVNFAKDTWGAWYPPEIGDYLETTTGTAYLIVGVEEGRTRNTYVLERAAECAPGCRVFTFYWLSRDRRVNVDLVA